MNKKETKETKKEVGFQTGQDLAVRERKENEAIAKVTKLSPEIIRLVKDTVARGATTEELQLFLYTAERRGLDPLARQIYFTKRWSTQLGREVMTIITSIDGFRAIAERSGKYAGQDEPVFEEDGNSRYPRKATVTVYRRDTPHGERYPIRASAYWDEYLPDEKHDFLWKKMPHVMLAKVAEAQALRKAFPEDLSGLYTQEEMVQSGIGPEDDQSTQSNRQLRMGSEELLLPFGTSVGEDVADAAQVMELREEEKTEKPTVKEESWKLPAASEKQIEEYLSFAEDPTLRTLAFKLINDYGAKHFDGLSDRDAEKVLQELRKASKLPRTESQAARPAEQKPQTQPAREKESGQMISTIQLNAIKQLVADPAKAKVAGEFLEETGVTKYDVLTHEEARELIRKLRAVKA